MSNANFQLPVHRCLAEPELAFHPERNNDRSIHPLKGLVEFGPYSRSLVNNVMDPIRVGMVVPCGEKALVNQLVLELEHRYSPIERRDYLPEFPGFSRVFGLRVVLASSSVQVELPGNLDNLIAASHNPHQVLAEKLTQAFSIVQAHRNDFDVLLVYLPDRWKEGFSGRAEDDFDLHDYIKAVGAVRGIPTQVLREESALKYPCRCSVMWRIGIALYCKAGGVPWKLPIDDPDVAYVGLSYALRPASANEPRFVTCCSQVFDADGSGLEFIAYETTEAHVERDNPFLDRAEMRKVMARTLSLYQRRHAGRVPKRVVIHKSTQFKPEEVEGCFDAWRSSEGLDLVQVQQDVIWRGIQIDPPVGANVKRGRASGYPVLRGSYVPIGKREVLLWTQGNAPAVAGRGRNFFKEGKGIPHPLLLTRFAGHGSWDEGCLAVLGLTKMNWNNDSLYDRLPVTMGYASILAKTIKRMPSIGTKPYQFRFFM
jgi:hypothetical protein